MNLYNSSFLILGEGTTYKHCSEFFEREHIQYFSTTTEKVININKETIVCQDKKINLKEIDYVVISPGIYPSNRILNQIVLSKCRLITDIEIIQYITKSELICVTGTNGKTSTVNMISNILNDNNIKAIACGNNGVSVFDSLTDSYDYIVLELSSYQLEYISKLDSYISLILNLSHDHIDRHQSFNDYFNTKLKIFKKAKHCIINKSLKQSHNYSTFEIKDDFFYLNNTKIDDLTIKDGRRINYKSSIYPVSGRHESLNLCASIAVLKTIGLSLEEIINSFSTRERLQHRVEEFLIFNGVSFINDSKSTNAHSTFNALESIEKNIILIMGGDNKQIPYKILSEQINAKVKKLIIIGDNKELLSNELEVDVAIVYHDNLDQAVEYIFSIMTQGDTVLLSPGTSSYCMYDNYQHRGNHFKELVNKHAC